MIQNFTSTVVDESHNNPAKPGQRHDVEDYVQGWINAMHMPERSIDRFETMLFSAATVIREHYGPRMFARTPDSLKPKALELMEEINLFLADGIRIRFEVFDHRYNVESVFAWTKRGHKISGKLKALWSACGGKLKTQESPSEMPSTMYEQNAEPLTRDAILPPTHETEQKRSKANDQPDVKKSALSLSLSGTSVSQSGSETTRNAGRSGKERVEIEERPGLLSRLLFASRTKRVVREGKYDESEAEWVASRKKKVIVAGICLVVLLAAAPIINHVVGRGSAPSTPDPIPSRNQPSILQVDWMNVDFETTYQGWGKSEISLHAVIQTGLDPPEDIEIDHIAGDSTDGRPYKDVGTLRRIPLPPNWASLIIRAQFTGGSSSPVKYDAFELTPDMLKDTSVYTAPNGYPLDFHIQPQGSMSLGHLRVNLKIAQ